MNRSKPVILAQAVLTGLGVLFAGTALADFIDPRWGALGALAVVATKGGIDFYVNATTTPTAEVVVHQPVIGGPVLAGEASPITTGVEVAPTLTVADVADIR